MGRKKVRLEIIRNQSVRKTTFRKRKAGLMKKVKELTTLCGIQGCAIIFNRHGGDSQTHVWPTTAEARAVLGRFQDLPPEKQTKHMKNHDGSEPRKRPLKRRRDRRESEVEVEMEVESLMRAVVDDRNEEKLFGEMRLDEMKELSRFLDCRITAIEREIDNLKTTVVDDVTSGSDEDDEDSDEEEESMPSD